MGLGRGGGGPITGSPPIGDNKVADIGFTPHAAIEKWAKYKEDYHLRFRWTPRRVFDVALWGVTVPFIFFKLFTHEQIRNERQNGRDDTDYWGESKKK